MLLKTLFAMAIISVMALQSVNAANKKDATMSDDKSKVINWDKPSKHDIVERAVSDGMTDPGKIVKWAENYKVIMTVDEVNEIKKHLKDSRQ